ncbi:hypothetical protein THICB1_70096 [Thiomonas arsenitoxydans]|uniref:Uncharacterized protein n=1 Tax=Thiomonas arsenitoxydans (strain DSM 22701 / CIP 110005 / 3As) TaxID=426114 RepID=A0ABP1Z5V2_THIA3|nr:hypothetical protein THICB1_70096 [Thiomonas arsenitoxydans]
MVEQRIENPRVDGSIPPLATNTINNLAPPKPRGFVFCAKFCATGLGNRLRGPADDCALKRLRAV